MASQKITFWSLLCAAYCCQLIQCQQISERVMSNYCVTDTVDINCGYSQAIAITRSSYGRMESGICAGVDREIGCEDDVTANISTLCTGKQYCTISNIAAVLRGPRRNCELRLQAYLAIEHICIPVAQGAAGSCGTVGYLKLRHEVGYISSYTSGSGDNLFGTSQCPWRIEASPGQRVHIYYLGYRGGSAEAHQNNHNQYCKHFGQVEDGTSAQQLTSCNNDNIHDDSIHSLPSWQIYASHSSTVQITMNIPRNMEHYILKYNVTGCRLPRLPYRSYTIEHRDHVTVHCNDTTEHWNLYCSTDNEEYESTDTEAGVCTVAAAGSSSETMNNVVPVGVTIFLILGIALVICVCILALGLFYIKKRNFDTGPKPDDCIYIPPPGYYPQRMDQLAMGHFDPMKQNQFATLDRTRAYTPMGAPPHGFRSPPQQHEVVNQEGIYQTIWRVKDQDSQSQRNLGPLPPTPQTPRQDFPTLAIEGRHMPEDQQPIMGPRNGTQEDLRPSAQSSRTPMDFNTFKPNKVIPRQNSHPVNMQHNQQFFLAGEQEAQNIPRMQPQHSQSQPQLDVMSAEGVAPFYYVLDPNHQATQATQDGANTMMTDTLPRPVITPEASDT